MGFLAAFVLAFAVGVLTEAAAWGVLTFGLTIFALVLAGRDPSAT